MRLGNSGLLILALSAALPGCQGKPSDDTTRQTTEGAGQLMADGPEAAAQRFGDAIKATDWAAAARLMHPAALRQLRTMFQPFFLVPEMQGNVSRMFGIAPEALSATPDTVLFAALLKNMLSQEGGLTEALHSAQITPLGHVPVGDTMMVVSRMVMTVEGITLTQYDVMPFVFDNGQWWALLKADISNLAAMIQRAAHQQS